MAEKMDDTARAALIERLKLSALRNAARQEMDRLKFAADVCAEQIARYETIRARSLSISNDLDTVSIARGAGLWVPESDRLQPKESSSTIEISPESNLAGGKLASTLAEVLSRRIELIRSHLTRIENDRRLVAEQLTNVDRRLEREFGDTAPFEIHEPVADEGACKDKSKRIALRPKYGNSSAEEMRPPKSVSDEEFQKLMARLDQLEEDEEDSDLEEEEEGEDDDSDEEKNSPPDSDADAEIEKKIDEKRAKDGLRKDELSGLKRGFLSGGSGKSPQQAASKEQQPTKKDNVGVRFAEQLESGPSGENSVPAAKSILRSREPGPIDREKLEEIRRSEEERKRLLPGSVEAFSGVVRERNAMDLPETKKDDEEGGRKKPEQQQKKKIMSKFKAQRLGIPQAEEED